MNTRKSNPNPPTITSSYAKFAIGFVAGITAITLPRIAAILGSANQFETANLVSAGYIGVGLVFAVLLGTIVVITEYKMPKIPRETFFTALAIPGVIAGSFTTILATGEGNREYQANEQLMTQFTDSEYILEGSIANEYIEIDFGGDTSPPVGSEDPSGLGFSFSFFPAASAAEILILDEQEPLFFTENKYSRKLSITRDTSRYLVSLGSHDDMQSAVVQARLLVRSVPTVKLIKSGDNYVILMDGLNHTKSEAIIRAVGMRQLNDEIEVKILLVSN